MAENQIEDLYPSSNQINTLYTYDTVLYSDSIEWCPHEPYQNFFVCGNYQLDDGGFKNKSTEIPQKRLGKILLFSISPVNGLKLWQILSTPAILDQKWCHNQINGVSVLGVVNSEKTLEIYKFKPQDKKLLKPLPVKFELELITSYKIVEADNREVLMLSLDWSTGKYESQEPEIICSDSKGRWHKFMFDKTGKLILLESSFPMHIYEAWIAAFYYWNTNVFFTGADDNILLKFDLRIGLDPVLENKTHTAGVTSIHSNAEREHIIVTGSYDEYLRLWDIRTMKSPVSALKMPGPLWRLKWDPFGCNYLLAACMAGGTHVVDGHDKDDLKITESYYRHKNITYGVDWSYLNESEVNKFSYEGNRIIASCSFYDHLLCVTKLHVEDR